MTNEELKPCPFCGGEASAISPDEVGCFNGECPSEPHVWAETEAIAAWNTRAIDPATDRIEQLQSKLDKAVAAMQALKDFDELPLSAKRPDVFERRVRHPILVALAEIKGE